MFRLLVCLSLVATALAQLGINEKTFHAVGAHAYGSHASLGGVDNVTPMHLSSLDSQDEFVALNHPRFPAHQVRVKKSNFCDPTVK